MHNGWYISIPNPHQLVVLYVQNGRGTWLYFHDKFPSFVRINDNLDYTCDATPAHDGSLDSFHMESFDSMYHVPHGHRYGVYMANNNNMECIPAHMWASVPAVDYKGVQPFMLSPSKT